MRDVRQDVICAIDARGVSDVRGTQILGLHSVMIEKKHHTFVYVHISDTLFPRPNKSRFMSVFPSVDISACLSISILSLIHI